MYQLGSLFFGAIDLSDVTDGMGDLSTALVTAAGLVIAAGLTPGGVPYGGPRLGALFKRVTP